MVEIFVAKEIAVTIAGEDLVEPRLNAERPTTSQARSNLDALFVPNSVAVIGATGRPGTVGRTVLENLLHGSFQGKVYAVNAKHPEVLGLKAYKSIRDIPGAVDLAVVATPAATVSQRRSWEESRKLLSSFRGIIMAMSKSRQVDIVSDHFQRHHRQAESHRLVGTVSPCCAFAIVWSARSAALDTSSPAALIAMGLTSYPL